MPDTAPLKQTLEQAVPAVTILATDDTVIGEAPFAGTVTGVSYTAEANITGAASPASRTFSLINKGLDGNGTTVVATLAMVGGVNALDFDELAITLSGTPANLVLVAGDVLSWNSAPVGGTGLVDPGGKVSVEITRS
jgi:hypothetical protein